MKKKKKNKLTSSQWKTKVKIVECRPIENQLKEYQNKHTVFERRSVMREDLW